jgi:hypothetical protein
MLNMSIISLPTEPVARTLVEGFAVLAALTLALVVASCLTRE